MSRVRSWLLAAGLLGRRRHAEAGRRPVPDEDRTELPPIRPSAGSERLVIGLLLAAAALGVAFVVVYAADAGTQWLGLSLGGAFAALAAAAVVAGKRLVPQERATEPRPRFGDQELERAVTRLVQEGGKGITRRRLLGAAALAAGGAMAAAAVAPVASLGPGVGDLRRDPWRRGRRLVDERGRPIAAASLNVGGFLTAFPEGEERGTIDGPLVVVRVPPDRLRLPAGREGWAPQGILAFSKTCTHAACAVSLFRYPVFRERSPAPALVCPCHYSTFEVETGGTVVYGPAPRPLPQLPLAIDREGNLVATGDLSANPGPSWLEVRES